MADVIVGKLKVEADVSGIKELKEQLGELKDGFPTTGQLVDKFVKSLKDIPGPVGVAAVALGALGASLIEMVKSTVEAETKMLELSEAMGIPIEKLQPFIEAMDLAGVTSEKLQSSVTKLSTSIEKALEDPLGKAADGFKKLGISQEELAKGDVEQIMKDAAKGLDQYADSAQKTALERELFGKQGPQIVAAMKDEAAMEAMATAAQQAYGTTITENDAKAAKYFGETLKLGMTMFQGVAMSVTKSLLPGLQELVNQFAESGKEGGFLNEVLKAAGNTIEILGKVIITALVIPVKGVVEAFQLAGMTIGAVLAAINAAAHGHLNEARDILKMLGEDAKKSADDFVASNDKFIKALWQTAPAIEKTDEATKEHKKTLEAYNPAIKKTTDVLATLKAAFEAQVSLMNASSKSTEDYQDAQAKATAITEEARLKQQGLKGAVLDTAMAYVKGTAAAKEATTQNLETLKQADAVQKLISADTIATAGAYERSMSAMKLTSAELTRKNELQKIEAQYQKDLLQYPTQVATITAAYVKNKEAINQNNDAILQLQQSAKGFTDGFSKGIGENLDSMQNMNKLGITASNKLLDETTTAFMNMGTQGKQAFSQLLTSMLTFMEQYIVKLLLAKAIESTMMAFGQGGVVGAGGSTPTAHAQGGAWNGGQRAFAGGDIVSTPTTFNMGLMGEKGPEAIMPLQRDANGTLGVKAAGGGGNGGYTNYNPVTINVHSNQDPQDIAAQTKRVFNQAVLVTKKTMTEQMRPGGLFNGSSNAFARSQ